MSKQHVFDHLGKAPYQLVDFGEGESACDYCGTYIRNLFHCKGTDGKRFVLGSSCVEKLGDAGLVKQVKDAQKRIKHEKQVVKAQELAKKQREDTLEHIDEMRERVSNAIPELKKRPHPNEFFASQGKTYYDYCCYFGPTNTELDELPEEYYIYRGTALAKIEAAGFKVF